MARPSKCYLSDAHKFGMMAPLTTMTCPHQTLIVCVFLPSEMVPRADGRLFSATRGLCFSVHTLAKFIPASKESGLQQRHNVFFKPPTLFLLLKLFQVFPIKLAKNSCEDATNLKEVLGRHPEGRRLKGFQTSLPSCCKS